ncbi:hypothetical protein BJ742DRAFT_773730 [Cladochytrium replicatum]|nr:hypothetical protein BJ742DRAFT_773730 [Cladochytrium replicatum]
MSTNALTNIHRTGVHITQQGTVSAAVYSAFPVDPLKGPQYVNQAVEYAAAMNTHPHQKAEIVRAEMKREIHAALKMAVKELEADDWMYADVKLPVQLELA